MKPELPARWVELQQLPNHPEMSVFPDRTPRIAHEHATGDVAFDCPSCGYDLTGIPPLYCPECGIALAYEPVPVFSSVDRSLAWAAAMVLDQHEVSNLIVVGSEPIVPVARRRRGRCQVMVPFKFYYEAVAALQARFDRLEYEEGESPRQPDTGPAWTCARCGEKSPGSFDICWNCSAARDPTGRGPVDG
jgi:hypothetical protein